MHYRKSRRTSQVSFQSEADAAVISKIRSPELSASDTVIAAQLYETLHGAIEALQPDPEDLASEVALSVLPAVNGNRERRRQSGVAFRSSGPPRSRDPLSVFVDDLLQLPRLPHLADPGRDQIRVAL